MKILQKICFVLLLTTFSSAYGGDCGDGDVNDCMVLAEQGNVKAQYNLALIYFRGKGVPKDRKEGLKWLRKSAEQGYDKSQKSLGQLYSSGRSTVVSQDYKEAVKWYRKSAEQGNSSAQYLLADLYEDGKGVIQDYKEAVRWYRKAAEQGDSDAQNELAYLYEDGKGVPQDYSEAVKWYTKSAENGSPILMPFSRLGELYEEGKGVPQDYIMAYMFFNILTSKIQHFSIARDRVAKKMTSSQIEKAQDLAREWNRKQKIKYENKVSETLFVKTSPEKETPTKKSQTNNSSSNSKITVEVIDDKTHSKNNGTAIVKGTVKTFLPYLFGYLFFFFITKQRNPFSKPVDVEQRPKWLFSLIVGMSFGVYGTSGVGIDSGDFLGYLVIKSAFFFMGVVFATLVFFIYRWKVRRNHS